MKKIKISRIILVVSGLFFLILGYRNRMENSFYQGNNGADNKNPIARSLENGGEKSPQLKELSGDADNGLKKPKAKNIAKDKEEQEEDIYVHITGAVRKEGLYKLKEGARLDDLIKECGGLLPEADISKINLSMILEDQMRLHLLKLGEKEDPNIDSFRAEKGSSPNSKQLGLQKKDKLQKVNINKASQEELMTLTGIGEKKAQAIIEYRQEKKFNSPQDLLEISGIGEKMLEKIIDQVTVK